jgi:acyl homoserine lactone synthase
VRVVGPDEAEVTQADILALQSLRKEVFIDGYGWDLCSFAEFEFDQYDVPGARYLIAYVGGRCVGGARLLSCDANFMSTDGTQYTYMLNDFCVGSLKGTFPKDTLTRALPNTLRSWEMTRFIAADSKITKALLRKANEFLIDRGAQEVITISPVIMPKMLRRMGFKCEVFSEKVNFDGRFYCAMSTAVEL